MKRSTENVFYRIQRWNFAVLLPVSLMVDWEQVRFALMQTETMLTEVQFEIRLNTDSQSVTTSSNNKTVPRFFTCRFGCLMQVGPSFFHLSLSLPLSVCLSLSLALILLLCTPWYSHWTLSHIHKHSHAHVFPSLGLRLTPAWNQFLGLHPPTTLFQRPFSLTTKWDWCCASLRMSTLPPQLRTPIPESFSTLLL